MFFSLAGDKKPNTKHQMSAEVILLSFEIKKGRGQAVLFSFQLKQQQEMSVDIWSLVFGF